MIIADGYDKEGAMPYVNIYVNIKVTGEAVTAEQKARLKTTLIVIDEIDTDPFFHP